MNWYVEHRYDMNRLHKIRLVPLADQWQLGPETRSLYAYPEAVVRAAREADSLAGLTRPLVRADWLFIDVDSGYDSVAYVEAKLQSYVYEKWAMGTSTRAHFHLPMAQPICSPHAIHSQRQWLGSLLGYQAPIDWSIYHKTGQIRMPGTVNAKRWAVKTLTHRQVSGDLVNIPVVVPDPVKLDQREVEEGRSQLVRLLTSREGRDGRHRHIYVCCQTAVSIGLEVDKLVLWMLQWNRRWASSPLSETEVVEHTTRTYRNALNAD